MCSLCVDTFLVTQRTHCDTKLLNTELILDTGVTVNNFKHIFDYGLGRNIASAGEESFKEKHVNLRERGGGNNAKLAILQNEKVDGNPTWSADELVDWKRTYTLCEKSRK